MSNLNSEFFFSSLNFLITLSPLFASMQSSALVLKGAHFSLLFYIALKLALWLAHLWLYTTQTFLSLLSLPDKTGSPSTTWWNIKWRILGVLKFVLNSVLCFEKGPWPDLPQSSLHWKMNGDNLIGSDPLVDDYSAVDFSISRNLLHLPFFLVF